MTDALWQMVQATLGPGVTFVRELSGGGMAKVYVADDAVSGRRVVIKLLSPELSASVDRERFAREIQVGAMLQHPNIVSVLQAGVAGETLFYVMPYVDGPSLRDVLTRDRELPLDRAMRIARDVAAALAHAHAHNIVHRDIKPDNILIDTATGRALVADFGIARAIEKATDLASVTSTGLTLGTPTYMSPEQASAEKHIDGRSDLYSLGCVCYEMLSGAPPFSGPTARAVISRHIQEPPPKIRVVRPDVPRSVERVLLRLLAKSPAARYDTAGAAATALISALSTAAPASGAADTLGDTAMTSVGMRPRWWRIVAVAALFVLVLASALPLLRRLRSGAPSHHASPNRIAVLYLDAVGGDSTLQTMARGLTRDLIYELSRVPDLQLISEAGIRRLAPRAPIDSVARTLGVGTVVTGTLEASGDSLLLDMHLVDAATLVERSALRARVPRGRLLSLRDSTLSNLSRELLRVIGRDAQQRALRSETSSVTAWELQQRARDLSAYAEEMPRRPMDFGPQLRTLTQAESLLALASRADPSWEAPVIERGWSLVRRAQLVTDAQQAQLLDSATALTWEAQRRWPGTARNLELRGSIEYERLRNGVRTSAALLDSAEADLRGATVADPQRGRAWSTLSAVLNRKGDSTGSLAAARRAIAVDGYERNVGRAVVALVIRHLFDRHADSARAVCASARQRSPTDPVVATCELSVLGWYGAGPRDLADYERALAAVERNGPFKLTADMFPVGRYWHAAILARSGLRDSARAVLARTIASLRAVGHADDYFVNEAQVRAALGDTDAALTLLEWTVAADPAKRGAIATIPWFDALRAEPRFRALVASR